MKALESMATKITRVRDYLDEYTLKDGRRIYVAGEGRLVNLAAAEGHPSAVMDMSFANQALAAEYLLKHSGDMSGSVYDMPEELDREIAALKLKAMGVEIAKRAAVRRTAYEQHLHDRSLPSLYQRIGDGGASRQDVRSDQRRRR